VNIFSSGPGAVAVIEESGYPPASLFLESWNSRKFSSIITSVAVQHRGNVHVAHTLQEFTHLYVFGDRVGEMTVSGVSFSRVCPIGILPQSHGLEWVHDYYLRNRVALRSTPVALVLGLLTVFRGFLLGAGIALNDPQHGMGQFSLKFLLLPPRTGGPTGPIEDPYTRDNILIGGSGGGSGSGGNDGGGGGGNGGGGGSGGSGDGSGGDGGLWRGVGGGGVDTGYGDGLRGGSA
jgi:hypothetical protein